MFTVDASDVLPFVPLPTIPLWVSVTTNENVNVSAFGGAVNVGGRDRRRPTTSPRRRPSASTRS